MADSYVFTGTTTAVILIPTAWINSTSPSGYNPNSLLPQASVNPLYAGSQLVCYGRITITNTGTATVTIDKTSAVTAGDGAIQLATGATVTFNYGNGPCDTWYAIGAAAWELSVIYGGSGTGS